MTNADDHVRVVQAIYAAYGRWDIAGILNAMTEDVVHDEPAAGPAPYRGTYRGCGEVRRFFEDAGAAIEVEQFEPREFIGKGDVVVVLGRYRFRVKATGRSYATDWAMAWRFRDGKVSGWTTYKDSAAEAAAFA